MGGWPCVCRRGRRPASALCLLLTAFLERLYARMHLQQPAPSIQAARAPWPLTLLQELWECVRVQQRLRLQELLGCGHHRQ